MHAVNKMLQTQFPDMQGLQSTLKSQTEFDPVLRAIKAWEFNFHVTN